MVWYGMVWYGVVWYGMAWYGMVWYGMVWHGMVWYGMLRCGTVWCGVVWCDVLCWVMVVCSHFVFNCLHVQSLMSADVPIPFLGASLAREWPHKKFEFLLTKHDISFVLRGFENWLSNFLCGHSRAWSPLKTERRAPAPLRPAMLCYFVYAWQVNGFKGAYKHHGKQRVPGLPTCHYGSRRRRHPRV